MRTGERNHVSFLVGFCSGFHALTRSLYGIKVATDLYSTKTSYATLHKMSGLNTESQGDISFSDCVPGNILFIKKRSFIDPGHLHRSGLPGDWLCHPALVVGSIEPDQVLICPVSNNLTH